MLNEYNFKASGQDLKFKGFMTLYVEGNDDNQEDDDNTNIPPLKVGQQVIKKKLEPKQSFTEPPARYTEASLVKTLEEVGVPVSLNYLTNLGFTTLDKKHDTGATIGLGGLTYGVTNLELTAAYASIANEGVYHKPHYYTKVVDNKGKVILQYKDSKKQVMKATTAWLLTDAMHDVVTKGTGTSANLSGMRVAGKTGTTDNSHGRPHSIFF